MQDGFKPAKYFSVDRVFRNEAIDRTHLAEFHQIEGLICDRGLTLGDLIGTLKEFFDRLGLKKLRFKPAFNPYTEPSMEIFRYVAEEQCFLFSKLNVLFFRILWSYTANKVTGRDHAESLTHMLAKFRSLLRVGCFQWICFQSWTIRVISSDPKCIYAYRRTAKQ